jgi:hypothetical protein
MRDKITEWVDDQETPDNGGFITIALVEHAIERHLRVSDEMDARALTDAAINKVVRRKHGMVQ